MVEKNSPQLRTQACDLAPTNWEDAAALAARIPDNWYASQAYAWCGRFAPDLESPALIEESFRRARGGADAYQRLAATAWPLRALLERGFPNRAADAFEEVAGVALEVEPASSRGGACFLVFEAVAVGPGELAVRALNWLLSALQPVSHWRENRAVRDAAIEAVTIGLIAASDVPVLVRDERIAATIARRLADGYRRQPRPFFWSRGNKLG